MDALVVIGLILWAVLGAGKKKKKQPTKRQKTELGDRMREIGSLIQEAVEEETAPVIEVIEAVREKAQPKEKISVDRKEPAPQPAQPAPEQKPFRYTEADFLGRAAECPACTPDEEEEEESAPALDLSFNRNAVLQGVIYSEVLNNRPSARRKTWSPYAR